MFLIYFFQHLYVVRDVFMEIAAALATATVQTRPNLVQLSVIPQFVRRVSTVHVLRRSVYS